MVGSVVKGGKTQEEVDKGVVGFLIVGLGAKGWN